MKQLLTSKQYELYLAIKYFIEEYGYSPTLRELTYILGLKTKTNSTMCNRLKILKRKGFIDYKENKPRTIRLLVDNYFR